MFFEEEDRLFFLRLLEEYAYRAGLPVISYCLMTNHTHLVAVPESPESLMRCFKPLHMRYSQYLNAKAGTTGLNWQGRFFSSPMDESYTWNTLLYVSLSPVVANIPPIQQTIHGRALQPYLEDELTCCFRPKGIGATLLGRLRRPALNQQRSLDDSDCWLSLRRLRSTLPEVPRSAPKHLSIG